MINVLTVFGTRPEAIKMAPIIQELAKYPGVFRSVVCVTGQHREMLEQVLQLFDIVPNYDLEVMRPGQTLSGITSLILTKLDPILLAEKPDWVLVQGDTTSAMAASIAAMHRGIRVGHVEAGLRSDDKFQPFPEELNRRLVSVAADLHFAPTAWAANNLRREGIPESSIHVTGNTVIDALKQVAGLPYDPIGTVVDGLPFATKRVILVTAHRRENHGVGMEQICEGLREVAESHDDVHVVYPVHLNPQVQVPVRQILGSVPNVSLLPPVEYQQLVWLLNRCHFVITDSGGIQEEAPGLGKPVLLLRETTERPEGVEAGTVQMIGANRDRIVSSAANLLNDSIAYETMAQAINPYGDGNAAELIVEELRWHGPRSQPKGTDQLVSQTFVPAPRSTSNGHPQPRHWTPVLVDDRRSSAIHVESTHLARALGAWIGSGAVQGPDGAFHAWLDREEGAHAFAYPEITGYALTYLAGRQAPSPAEIDAGRRAGQWLVARFSGGDLSARTGWDNGAIYNFDLAMIASGMMTFGDRFDDPTIASAGLDLARDLIAQVEPDGAMPSISPSGPASSRDGTGWSNDGRAHLVKVAQSLLIAERHGMDGAAAAKRLVAWGCQHQQDDGRFVTQLDPTFTMLHPHMYAAEGLWILGMAHGDDEFLARARSAIDWVWGHQLETGGFPRLVTVDGDAPSAIEQMDVTSQVIRMTELLGVAQPGLDAALRRLGQVAVSTDAGSALVYQPSAPTVHLNAWVTMFGAQAAEVASVGAPPLAWTHLV